MPVTYGTSRERTARGMRSESWAELDGVSIGGDSFVIRVTAIWPYKDYSGRIGRPNRDELHCHLDYWNVTQQIAGRYPSVWLEARGASDGDLRRFAAIRTLQRLMNDNTIQPITSPVFNP